MGKVQKTTKKKIDKMKFQLDKVQGVYITKKHEMFEKNKKSDNAALE